ncbi:unnamed protein product [Gongylonema pulchrum]|uniref:Uncharacterized protein n=1 Tax=Gongylonema pulchrum TaxID=637853 RepID=A0A3P6QNN5_9BILA|nr:unnamed protein product [Gongylonema pulchrum]
MEHKSMTATQGSPENVLLELVHAAKLSVFKRIFSEPESAAGRTSSSKLQKLFVFLQRSNRRKRLAQKRR